MPSLRRLTAGLFALTVLTALTAGSAHAAWPDKPIRIIVPYPPGGPSDIVLRAVIEKMQPVLKQPIVLENKPGAGGNLGAAEAARAAPDGHTWFFATDNVVTINPHVYMKAGFKPDDLVPVAVVSSFSQTLVCHPSLGAKTLADFVKAAQATKLAYASGGAGAPGHLAMELLLATAGVEMEHIPYKGPALAAQDVIGGQVPCGFLAGPTVLPHIRSGRIVALAVSGSKRSPVLPEVPTVAEAGFPGYDASFLLAVFAPKGVPDTIFTAFHKAFVDALRQPDMAARLQATDQSIVAGTPAEAAAQLNAISKKWGEVARRIHLSLD